MAQRSGDDELADRLGGISLDSVSAAEGKSSVGPAGLIHKVRYVTLLFQYACRLASCAQPSRVGTSFTRVQRLRVMEYTPGRLR